ncbi:ATP-binding protein [Sphaerisporangium corydalis]|uniref:ATP-binding protein n=1 Tax=Sphaerisporangium corydalis TaxID=1441875 RepID=A0ABV9EFM2_9ACTN|nr:ATP-binding protein [Sphaerisporangium corydalis]
MTTLGLIGTIHLPGRALSVHVARAFVREALRADGWQEVDEAELLVSELFTNAVRHSRSGSRPHGLVTLVVTEHTGSVRIEVIDEGSPERVPSVQDADVDGDGGRGLWLVEQIASTWGVRENLTGRAVWFEISDSRSGPVAGDLAFIGMLEAEPDFSERAGEMLGAWSDPREMP